jgi:hypothetical protein
MFPQYSSLRALRFLTPVINLSLVVKMKGKHKARIGDYPVFLKLRGKSSHYFRRERASDDAGPARRCSLNYFCISSFLVVPFISPLPILTESTWISFLVVST